MKAKPNLREPKSKGGRALKAYLITTKLVPQMNTTANAISACEKGMGDGGLFFCNKIWIG